MLDRAKVIVILLITYAFVPSSYAQNFLSGEDNPALIDQFFQVVWEPTSLIRMWVGLDQLYNIALGWRTAAKRLITLPFAGNEYDHIKIQEPRTAKYLKPSGAAHFDRFQKIYASSSLSPLVAQPQQHIYNHQPGNVLVPNLRPLASDGIGSNLKLLPPLPSNVLGPNLKPLASNMIVPNLKPSSSFVQNLLPSGSNIALGAPSPLLLFPPQKDIFNSMDVVQSTNGQQRPLPLGVKDDPMLLSKLIELQELENLKVFQNKMFFSHLNNNRYPPAKQLGVSNGAQTANLQERLNSFLKLMKTLGDLHENDISRKSLKDRDS